MIQTSRRSFLGGVVVSLFAPAIVKFDNLMPTKLFMPEPVIIRSNSLLTLNMITKDAIRLFKQSNLYIQNIDRQYEGMFS